jgi:Sec-independent protein translocase protein TatA
MRGLGKGVKSFKDGMNDIGTDINDNKKSSAENEQEK